MGKLSRGQKMRRVRAQVMLVHRMQEQLHSLMPEIRSPMMSGIPGNGGGIRRGLDVKLAKKDALERMLSRESEILREYEREARDEMDGMRPEQYAFCSIYYLTGLSIEETAEMIDRSLRQCRRYKAEIEGEENERQVDDTKDTTEAS